MNPRQSLFVSEYLVDRNAKEAAIRAGYKESRAVHTGYELLQREEIALAVRKADSARQKELGVDADWIVSRLLQIHEKAFVGVPKADSLGRPLFDGDGNQVVEWSPSGATKPLELLMKHLGMGGVEKHEVTVSGGPVVYTLMLDRELPETDE